MLTLHNIRTAFLKKYDLVLKHCAQDLALEQIIYPINSKLYDQFIDFSILSKAVKTIIENSKEYKKNGYWILYKDINLKKFGKQKLPKSLYFETAEDYFYFLGKGEEYNFFKSNLALTIRQFHELKTWAQSKPIKLIENAHCWDSILAVCEYFTHNPSPNCFIRDIFCSKLYQEVCNSSCNQSWTIGISAFILATDSLKSFIAVRAGSWNF